MIRKELYGDYVVARNEVVIDEKMLIKSAKYNDSRFGRFTKEEREEFEKIYKEHMRMIYGDNYNDTLIR